MSRVPASRIHELTVTMQVVAAWRTAHRLTANQAEVVSHVYDHGAVTASQLSRLVGITTASMTRLVARLEADDWIERSPDAYDGRRIVLQPTKQLVRAIDELEVRLDASRPDARDERPA